MSRRRDSSSTSTTCRWRLASGLCIVADTWGHPDSPLMLMLHGGGQTRHAWKELGEVLGAAGYRAVALDARGHGDSDWAPDGVYDEDAFVSDIVQVLDVLGDHRPAVVGASLGGGTALVATGEGYVGARALLIVDIGPTVAPEGAQRIRDFMRPRPEGFGSLKEVADAIAEYLPQRRRPASVDGLVKNLRLGADGRYRWHWDPKYHDRRIDLAARERRMTAATWRFLRSWCVVVCPTS